MIGDPQEVVEGGVVSVIGQPRAAKALAADIALEPGEMSVTSSVTVAFQIH